MKSGEPNAVLPIIPCPLLTNKNMAGTTHVRWASTDSERRKRHKKTLNVKNPRAVSANEQSRLDTALLPPSLSPKHFRVH